MITQTLKAKYHGGVLEPMERLDLREGEVLRIIIRRRSDEEEYSSHDTATQKKHYLDNISQLRFEDGPTDGSVNHDAYIYDNPHIL